ncbi:DMT family transporter [Yoonia sp.]|uniref:DMT family transporter n=1 Tax=Yoonia sp. TaxID=2212373 RepID=UPI0025ECA885|nr:DMT family transporter [Yoonia sp.]
MPVRGLAGAGLPGAWGTVAITLAAAVILAPVAAVRWRRLARAQGVALLSVGLGGAAFALYSVGFVYGRVAIIILLYFLTPVWSTLIGRYVMGWDTPRSRVLAIAVGLAGLVVMLGAHGGWPVPQGAGEWRALIAGILWSVGTTGMRATSDIGLLEAAFVFASGALVMALVLAPFLEPWPASMSAGGVGRAAFLAVATGVLWWIASIAGLMWATVRLDPARVGILLIAEVLAGAISAAVMVNEHLSAVEIAGGCLVLLAGVLEVWPMRRRRPVPHR